MIFQRRNETARHKSREPNIRTSATHETNGKNATWQPVCLLAIGRNRDVELEFLGEPLRETVDRHLFPERKFN